MRYQHPRSQFKVRHILLEGVASKPVWEAALPLDVRRGFAPPYKVKKEIGLCPPKKGEARIKGRAHVKPKVAAGQSPASHPAAEPLQNRLLSQGHGWDKAGRSCISSPHAKRGSRSLAPAYFKQRS